MILRGEPNMRGQSRNARRVCGAVLWLGSAISICVPNPLSGSDVPEILRAASAHYQTMDEYAVRIAVVTTHDFETLHGQSRGGPMQATMEGPLSVVIVRNGVRLRYEQHEAQKSVRDMVWIDDSSTVFKYSAAKNAYREEPSAGSKVQSVRPHSIWEAEWRYISKFQLLSTLPFRVVKGPKREETCGTDALVLETVLEKRPNYSSSERISLDAASLLVCRSVVTTQRVGTDGVFQDRTVVTWAFEKGNTVNPKMFRFEIPPGAKREVSVFS